MLLGITAKLLIGVENWQRINSITSVFSTLQCYKCKPLIITHMLVKLECLNFQQHRTFHKAYVMSVLVAIFAIFVIAVSIDKAFLRNDANTCLVMDIQALINIASPLSTISNIGKRFSKTVSCFLWFSFRSDAKLCFCSNVCCTGSNLNNDHVKK